MPVHGPQDPGHLPRRPSDHIYVLFGSTGDLAKRKLLPGLFHLCQAGLLPEGFRIVGTAPTQGAPDEKGFREHARQALVDFAAVKPTAESWAAFDSMLSFAAADLDNPEPLCDAVAAAESALGDQAQRLFHLAVPPVAFGAVVEMLGSSGLAQGARCIIEKPFGTDLASACALNEVVHKVFDESAIFRIDHFLGKESVENILAFRFANGLFEPVWNRDHIDYVLIDVPESLSIEGRAAFYEGTGAYRDMIVTHLFQVLGFVAMEPPTQLTAKALRSEKEKVFDAVCPIDVNRVVRGQYEGYRSEPGVDPDSQTETMVALRVEIENWRWCGVPFCLRTGKSMAAGRQVITIGFREPTMRMFDIDAPRWRRANEINIDFSDPGSITANFLAKEPGPQMRLGGATMTFRYEESFAAANDLAGYERLILDAMLGDQSMFTTSAAVERLWEVSTPLLEQPPPVQPYAPGSWGPGSVDSVPSPYRWHLPEAP